MSIVRVGLGESQHYAAGWEAIFGGKSRPSAAGKPKTPGRTASKQSGRKKLPKKK
jgi:hypothetical protein